MQSFPDVLKDIIDSKNWFKFKCILCSLRQLGNEAYLHKLHFTARLASITRPRKFMEKSVNMANLMGRGGAEQGFSRGRWKGMIRPDLVYIMCI